MIFLDTNIFMYAAGSEHPNKSTSVKMLEMVAIGKIEAAISVEVLQEILHRYTYIGRKEDGMKLARMVMQMIPTIYEVELRDIQTAMYLLKKYEINSRDALHAAVAINNSIETICTYDSHFSEINEIRLRKPEEILKEIQE